jgi:two-component system response regulator CpxR
MSLVAIFSGDHSSAELIVQQVASKLGYAVVARELLEEAAREFNVAEDKLARALTGSRGFFNVLTREWEKSLIYTQAALAQLLRTDEQVYHGPATHLIPESISHVLRVGIIADQPYRIDQAGQAGLQADEARNRLRKNDEELAQWTQLIHASEPWDPDLYDVLIPIPDTSVERAVELICESVEKEALKPTDSSIQAVLDYQLATSLNVSLLDRGHANCEVTASAGKVTVVVNQGAPSPGKLARTVKALRYDKIEEKIREVCAAAEGVDQVEVRPGVGYDRAERRSRTLLVDDEREYVMTLSERLDVRDIPSDVVYDGKQALTFVNTDVPDVMVLDLKMPGMDGMEVLRQIKQDHPNVEVIIVTGHGSDEDERLARELGAFDFLKKPIDINVLAVKIKEASRKARGTQSDDKE